MTIETRKLRYLAGLIAAVCVAAAAYAFTAANTVPGTSAGAGSGAISGYTVSNVAYTFGATPTNLASVTFTLDKAAGTVKAQVQSGGSWYSCTNTTGNDWSCATTSPQATVQAADQLTVVATS